MTGPTLGEGVPTAGQSVVGKNVGMWTGDGCSPTKQVGNFILKINTHFQRFLCIAHAQWHALIFVSAALRSIVGLFSTEGD